jgi:DNA-binding CsgD family transcriptional regulator
MGLALSAVVLSASALSAHDQVGRSLAALVVAAAWFAVRRQVARRLVPTFTATELVGAAALTSVPFAVDGHAQSSVFLAMAPLGALAALCGNRREMQLFAGTWILAYTLGAVLGTGPGALVERHGFDGADQVVTMIASCGVFCMGAELVRAYAADLDDEVRAAESARTVPGASLHDDVEVDNSTDTPGHDLDALTGREKEILRLATEDKQLKEIAAELHVSPRTVESDSSRLVRKLGARAMTEAVSFYVKHPRK